MPTPDEVQQLIADHLHDRTGARPTLHESYDVIADGGLDSLGFLELLTILETEYDRELDLSEAPEQDMTRVGTLVRAARSGS